MVTRNAPSKRHSVDMLLLLLPLLVMEAAAGHIGPPGPLPDNQISGATIQIASASTAVSSTGTVQTAPATIGSIIHTSLRGKNRWLAQRKDDLFSIPDDKHPSNDVLYDANANIAVEDEQPPADDGGSSAREEDGSFFSSFDADKYRDVVEKAKAKTLKGANKEKEDKEEKTDKEDKEKEGKDEDQKQDQDPQTEMTANDIRDEVDESANMPGAAQESIVQTVAEDEALTKATPEGIFAEPMEMTLEFAEGTPDGTENAGSVQSNDQDKPTNGVSATGTPAAEATEAETTSDVADAETKAAYPEQPFPLETIPLDTASIVNGDTSSNAMPNQNQAGIRGMGPGGKVGISFAFIALFAMIVAVAAIRRGRRNRQDHYWNDLEGNHSDEEATDRALPLYIATPTAAKGVRTDSESGESDDEYDDDISDLPLPAYMAKYSVAASPSPAATKGGIFRERGREITDVAAEDWAKVRELDGIVAGIANQDDTTEDSIWDLSSAPTLNTTDSAMERFPIPARDTSESALEELSVDAVQPTSSNWVQFSSCAVWPST